MKEHTLGTAALFIISLLSALQVNASTPQKVLFCWSPPDHAIGTHAYEQFAHSMTALFSRIDNIEAQEVRGFPSDEQWADSDLVVFFLTQNRLTDSQFAQIDKHLEQGKSILALHQGLVQRGSHNQWAERIGFAFNWEEGEKRSKWGKFNNHRITLDTSSKILSDFPASITFSDELYWNLKKASRGEITILGETTAPGVEESQADQKWPILWTVQHPSIGNADGGRAFGAVLGHFNEMRNSPVYQAILLRGIAWCLREPFAPFIP
ncbi:MAG: hypothetical protein HN457_11655 [Opitutales bacterium]|nr:hypothetical protein [Opitutales bacterium]MBT5814444.1 hypothetical protein [Opitutales bacterium]